MAFSQKIVDLKKEVLAESQELFAHVDAIAEENTLKVLDAMRECKVSDAHFNTTSGYAYDDIGRSKLEELYAKIFGAHAVCVWYSCTRYSAVRHSASRRRARIADGQAL